MTSKLKALQESGYVQYGKRRIRIVPLKEGGTKLKNRYSLVRMGIIDIAEIGGLDEQISLKELRLSFNQISEIKGLGSLKGIEKLYLNENKIKELKGLEKLTNLRILDLSSNQISEIKGLEHLTNLEELYLNGNRIKEVEGLDNLTNLRFLDISYNEITESKAIVKLTNFKKLELRCVQKLKTENINLGKCQLCENNLADKQIQKKNFDKEFTLNVCGYCYKQEINPKRNEDNTWQSCKACIWLIYIIGGIVGLIFVFLTIAA